jgi:hypothetical protein
MLQDTPLASHIRPPTIPLQLDMLNLAWPAQTAMARPQVPCPPSLTGKAQPRA